MKYLPLVWAGLWRTPLRTALTFLSIATTFLLFGSLYGVNAGLNQTIERISATRLHVTPVNLDHGLPVHYRQEIDQIPGVASTMISSLMSAFYRLLSALGLTHEFTRVNISPFITVNVRHYAPGRSHPLDY